MAKCPSFLLNTAALLLAAAAVCGCGGNGAGPGNGNTPPVALLNASYDPTRELWKDVNSAFQKAEAAAGRDVQIRQSHGASGSQAKAVIDGLQADVVSLALWSDTDQLRRAGVLKDGWEQSLPNRSLPYTSTIVFVVRKGNPKGIRDWADLIRDGVEVITPNPRTSGNGRLSFLAAWGSVILNGGTEEQAREFVRKLYQRVPVLDTGARGATTTFAQRGLGDVHLTWESEAYLELQESGGELELVFPSRSILAEPHVAVVDRVVDERGTREVAERYLKFLYTPEGQELIAKHRYRPTDAAVLEKHREQFPALNLFRVEDLSGSWSEAQAKFFADGGEFDQIYVK
ncbi:MAG: sulfate ABC transporter substrate-binding protein [Planctomycetota bacterium]